MMTQMDSDSGVQLKYLIYNEFELNCKEFEKIGIHLYRCQDLYCSLFHQLGLPKAL